MTVASGARIWHMATVSVSTHFSCADLSTIKAIKTFKKVETRPPIYHPFKRSLSSPHFAAKGRCLKQQLTLARVLSAFKHILEIDGPPLDHLPKFKRSS
jgi:hypothetical protein